MLTQDAVVVVVSIVAAVREVAERVEVLVVAAEICADSLEADVV